MIVSTVRAAEPLQVPIEDPEATPAERERIAVLDAIERAELVRELRLYGPPEEWTEGSGDRATDEAVADPEVDSGRATLEVDPVAGIFATRLLSQIASAETLTRRLFAETSRAMAQLVDGPVGSSPVVGTVALEDAVQLIAVELGISARAASFRVDEAIALKQRPAILAAVAGGWMPIASARVVVRETGHVTDQQVLAEAEARVLDALGVRALVADGPQLGRRSPAELELLDQFLDPDALHRLTAESTTGRMRELTRRALASVDADALRAQQAKASDARAVEVGPSGMAGLSMLTLVGPDAQIAAAYDRIDTQARVDRSPDDDRTVTQARADLAFDLLLGPLPNGSPGPALNLHVLFHGEDLAVGVAPRALANLDHVGAVAPDTLLALAVLSGRTQGQVVPSRVGPAFCPGRHESAGPYKPSRRIRAAVMARDRTCRFPGCAVPAVDCDLDHVIPHPLGPTCLCNLICVCRRHHRLKTHHRRWTVVHDGHGRLRWTTPTGRILETRPASERAERGPPEQP